MSEDIRFYCGIGEKDFNHHPVFAGQYACVSPVVGRGGIDRQGKQKRQGVNGVCVPPEVKSVLLDSGAYSDTTFHRKTFEDALHRQLDHAERFKYLSQVSRLVSYDVLVDEQMGEDGERVKDRMSPDVAMFAVQQTVKAAEYLSSQRDYIYERIGHPVSLTFSAQGSDTRQYLECAKAILPYVQPGDTFALGGWCILGQRRTLIPMFYETMNVLIPLCKQYKVKDIHIFGVCVPEVLGPLLFLCDHEQRKNDTWGWDEKKRIRLSTDSVGPTTRVVKEFKNKPGFCSWGYGSWYNGNYPLAHVEESCKIKDEQGRKAPACSPDTKCRGLERQRHVQATIEWLANFRVREPEHYHSVETSQAGCGYEQLSWLEAAI